MVGPWQICHKATLEHMRPIAGEETLLRGQKDKKRQKFPTHGLTLTLNDDHVVVGMDLSQDSWRRHEQERQT